MAKFSFVVYKITFPNGKIYVGKDIAREGHSIRYFGSWDHRRVEEDFTKSQLLDFTIRREIIFESDNVQEINHAEMRLIVELGANDPQHGYNKIPKFNS